MRHLLFCSLIALSLGAVAGIASKQGVEVEGFDAAAVSYPRFAADLALISG